MPTMNTPLPPACRLANCCAGMNNAYLITTRHELATRYNDTSVLENSHVSSLYELIKRNPELDIFQSLSNEHWRTVRKLIIQGVIHTDMTYHFPMVSKVCTHLRTRLCLSPTLSSSLPLPPSHSPLPLSPELCTLFLLATALLVTRTLCDSPREHT